MVGIIPKVIEEVYELDSECIQAKVSVPIDLTISFRGSFG